MFENTPELLFQKRFEILISILSTLLCNKILDYITGLQKSRLGLKELSQQA